MMASDNDAAYAANRARWDESVPLHVASAGYNVEGFLRGGISLYGVETEEVGDVRGKRLLHLQCHFGMDTLSWARLGAVVTGLDFSAPAIAEARKLAERVGLAHATFVQSDLYGAREAVHGQFDIVYTGTGALCWLHDIREWARIVAHFVAPGGFAYVYEGHPVLRALQYERDDQLLVLGEPYFQREKASEYDGECSYVDGPPLENTKTFEWNHGLGETVMALIDAGLQLEFLREHREAAWQALPWMVPDDGTAPPGTTRHQRQRYWRLPEGQRDYCPLMFSLKASKRE